MNFDITNKDYRYFEVAKSIAKTSDYRRTKIGAVVVYKKKIILAVGCNTYKTHPIQKYYNKYRFSEDSCRAHTLHAETQALLKISKYDDINLSEATIYTYRDLADGSLAKSRPCKSCMNIIKDYGIKRICYTTYDGFCEEILI